MKKVENYSHPAEVSGQKPDTKPGDYYVSVVDRGSNDGRGRTALALGPFPNDHAGALARVDEVRSYVTGADPRATWWAFGTVRIDSADGNPVGKLNEKLGFEALAA
jgi:hypothetical protein